jgi:hypothetical protein
MMAQIAVDEQKIATFCHKHQIRRLALFGSALRADFRPDSDVDVLVEFSADAKHGLFALSRMEDKLRRIFGREVDLVDRAAIEQSRNYIRRKEILSALETIYGAPRE